jgi:hypothetical protein
MTKRTKRLLPMIADAVDAAPEKEFSMATWDCGTTACAIGWACRDPEFCEASGLKLKKIFNRLYPVVGITQMTDFDAVAQALGMSEQETYFLFDPSQYDNKTNRHAVSARIRTFAESGGGEK